MDTIRNKDLQKSICEAFGEDIDSEVCQEIGKFMEECPECQVYYDTMQRSVKLYIASEKDEEIPAFIATRLYKVLNLDQLKASQEGVK